MDCGIPFCHNGCPVNNLIPDWNNLVYRDQLAGRARDPALDQQLPGIHRPHLPRALRGVLHAEHRRQPGDHQDRSNARSSIAAGTKAGSSRRSPAQKTGKRVAVVGSGPAGMACAQQLARAGHAVTLFEKADRIGGLLRYGIPDFKMEKHLIDRRMRQMEAEGVEFRTGVEVGATLSIKSLLDGLRRGGADRRRRMAARPRGAGPRARRHPFRHGFPDPAEQARRRRRRGARRAQAARSPPRASTSS